VACTASDEAGRQSGARGEGVRWEGVEPEEWLYEQARKRKCGQLGRNVRRGAIQAWPRMVKGMGMGGRTNPSNSRIW
jgi:hypothetical protein